MIDEIATFETYGYFSITLSPKSNKDIIVICDQCGKKKINKKAAYRGLCKVCSCTGERNSNYGNRWSDEQRKRASERNDTAGKKNPRYGVKLSDETKDKISKAKTGNTLPKHMKGENHWNYNHLLSEKHRRDRRVVPGFNDWRKDVYKKDDYTCQCCGKRGINLNAHHIESYNCNPKLRISLDNGITLCKGCHNDFHHRFGWGSNTKEQLDVFLNNGGLI